MIDYIDGRIEELRLELEELQKKNAANIWTCIVLSRIDELRKLRIYTLNPSK